jgi:hypothetical protein
MTIYEIKKLTKETAPYFFSRKTMKYFGQTMKDFTVKKLQDNRYLVTAPMYHRNGVLAGKTVRYFNPSNNELEFK